MENAHQFNRRLSPLEYDKWSSMDDWWNSDLPELNVGGHQVYIDSKTGQVISKDIWKYNPWDWTVGWRNLNGSASQAGIMDKLGTPFITVSENKLNPEALLYLKSKK